MIRDVQFALLRRLAAVIRRRLAHIVSRGRTGYLFLHWVGADINGLERDIDRLEREGGR